MAKGEEPQDLIRDLLKRELETVNVYMEMAASAKSPTVRALIREIAEQEKHHIAEAVDMLARYDERQAQELVAVGLRSASARAASTEETEPGSESTESEGTGSAPPSTTVVFEPVGLEVDVVHTESLLDAALRSGIDIRHDCGGHGECGTCRVEVLVGQTSLSSVTDPERNLLAELLDTNWRLACQTRALGPLRLRVPENRRSARGSDA